MSKNYINKILHELKEEEGLTLYDEKYYIVIQVDGEQKVFETGFNSAEEAKSKIFVRTADEIIDTAAEKGFEIEEIY